MEGIKKIIEKIIKTPMYSLRKYPREDIHPEWSFETCLNPTFDYGTTSDEILNQSEVDDDYEFAGIIEISNLDIDTEILLDYVEENFEEDIDDYEDLEDLEDLLKEFIETNFDVIVDDYEEEIIDKFEFRMSNDMSNDMMDKIKDELSIHYGVEFDKYTNVNAKFDKELADDSYIDFSFSVRIADHSQRRANIRTDYSISIVIADEDATAGERNYYQKGFSAYEAEAGEANHAQIYINSEMSLDDAVNYIIESIDNQIKFAKEEYRKEEYRNNR